VLRQCPSPALELQIGQFALLSILWRLVHTSPSLIAGYPFPALALKDERERDWITNYNLRSESRTASYSLDFPFWARDDGGSRSDTRLAQWGNSARLGGFSHK